MDRSIVLPDYLALRAAGKALSGKLVKLLSKEDIHTAGRRLGILQGKTLMFDTEDEVAVLMDYAIHEVFRDGQNAIDRMLRDNPPAEDTIELRVLRSSRSSHFSIVEVTEAIPGFGVEASDHFRESSVVIVDQGLGSTAIAGATFATRLHSPGEGWWMTTGAGLPLTDEAREKISIASDRYRNQHGKYVEGADRTALIIRECLAAGASENIRYADPGTSVDSVRGQSARAGIKVGRNDPCPCGSGKKFKKCCGG